METCYKLMRDDIYVYMILQSDIKSLLWWIVFPLSWKKEITITDNKSLSMECNGVYVNEIIIYTFSNANVEAYSVISMYIYEMFKVFLFFLLSTDTVKWFIILSYYYTSK